MPISITDDLFIKILTNMWYIWKARNDNKFQRKTWTPWLVHHDVAAHINTTTLATSPLDDPHGTTEEALHHTESGDSSPQQQHHGDLDP
jgi:hypothetical protein